MILTLFYLIGMSIIILLVGLSIGLIVRAYLLKSEDKISVDIKNKNGIESSALKRNSCISLDLSCFSASEVKEVVDLVQNIENRHR
ncbi:hypothetical protein [Fusibacter sp. JL216-2]|uniref:hypothetical protein n=1 Tax=Fusibacter sp. JL216-2 TaxID=3071453 RepID=UPI003D3512D1